jgi:uncharacterized protein
MATAEIQINVGDLDAGGKEFKFPLRAAWLRGLLEDHEATASGPDGVLDVRVSRSGNDVVVHGTLRAELEVPCARCLTPVPLPIDQTLSLLFVPGKVTPPPVNPKAAAAAGKADAKADAKSDAKSAPRSGGKRKKAELEEYEISEEDADTLPYEGEVVVLDEVVRDELILETPIFPLCSEDCPGMSPPPGMSFTPASQPSQKGAAAGGGTAGSSDLRATSKTEAGGASAKKSDDVAANEADVDPRLRPLLRLKTRLKTKID